MPVPASPPVGSSSCTIQYVADLSCSLHTVRYNISSFYTTVDNGETAACCFLNVLSQELHQQGKPHSIQGKEGVWQAKYGATQKQATSCCVFFFTSTVLATSSLEKLKQIILNNSASHCFRLSFCLPVLFYNFIVSSMYPQ